MYSIRKYERKRLCNQRIFSKSNITENCIGLKFGGKPAKKTAGDTDIRNRENKEGDLHEGINGG